MDELADELGIDPVELRLRNRAAIDPRGHPWSSDGLRGACGSAPSASGGLARDPTPRRRRTATG